MSISPRRKDSHEALRGYGHGHALRIVSARFRQQRPEDARGLARLLPVRQGEARVAGVSAGERVARYAGRRCRTGTIKDVAKEINLDWQTVKRLQMRYMRAQLEHAAKPSPQTLGIDGTSICNGHLYRIAVSDLNRQRPIWFGGQARFEQSLDECYRFLGEKKAHKVRLAATDMWKPLRNSTIRHAPRAAILFDEFYVLPHLGDALDKVRTQEYAMLSGNGRAFIKGPEIRLPRAPTQPAGFGSQVP